ncbi:MAG: PEP-CTERM sorting domain-containing protein [Verrucomicrobiota bacterium]
MVFLTGFSAARADVLVDFSPVGGSQTRLSITGELTDLDDDNGLRNASDSVSVSGTGLTFVDYASTSASFEPAGRGAYSIDLNPGPFSDAALDDFSAGFSGGDFRLSLPRVFFDASVTVFPQASSITFNEDVVLDIPHALLNEGTWTWGSPGGDVGDGITLTIQPVPEPTGLSLGLAALALLAGRRRNPARR